MDQIVSLREAVDNVLLETEKKLHINNSWFSRLKVYVIDKPLLTTIVATLLNIIITCIAIEYYSIWNKVYAIVDQSVWQSFVNTGWQVHSGILAISITLVIFLLQVASSTKRQKSEILQVFARKVWLYPILIFGLIGIILWGIVGIIAMIPTSTVISASLLASALINSFLTIIGIGVWYFNVMKVFNSEWYNNIADEILKKTAKRATYLEVMKAFERNLFYEFVSANEEKFSFTGPINNTTHHAIQNKKKKVLYDVDFKKLSQLLSKNAGEIIVRIQPSTIFDANKSWIWLPNDIDQTTEQEILKCFTFKKPQKDIPQVAKALEALGDQFSQALREQSISEVKQVIESLLTIYQESMGIYSRLNIDPNSGLFEWNTRYLLKRRFYLFFELLSTTNLIELHTVVVNLLFSPLNEAMESKNIFIINDVLELYRQQFKTTVLSQSVSRTSKMIFEKAVRIPHNYLFFSSKRNSIDDGFIDHINTSVIEHYHELFYLASKTGNAMLLESMFSAVRSLLRDTLGTEGQPSDIFFGASFGWISWIIKMYQVKEISEDVLVACLNSYQEITSDLVTLAHSYEVALTIDQNNRAPWVRWQEYEEEHDTIKVGIYSYAYHSDIPLLGYSFVGLLLSGRKGVMKRKETMIQHTLNAADKKAEEIIKDTRFSNLIKPDPNQALELFQFFNRELNDVHILAKQDRILHEPLSLRTVSDLSLELNQYLKKNQQENYNSVSSIFRRVNRFLEMDWNKVDSSTTLHRAFLPKEWFLSDKVLVFGLERSIIPLIEKVEHKFYEKCLHDAFFVNNLNNSKVDLIDSMFETIERLGAKGDLLFLPWGTPAHKLFLGNSEYSFGPDFLGTYKGTTIHWLPSKYGKQVLVLSTESLEKWDQGTIKNGESDEYLKVNVKPLEEDMIKSIARRNIRMDKNHHSLKHQKLSSIARWEEEFKKLQLLVEVKYEQKVNISLPRVLGVKAIWE